MIQRGEQQATIAARGGALVEYRLLDQAILEPAGPNDDLGAYQGVPLVPWPNRIRAGRYDFGGRRLKLPLSEAGRGNAIHGLASSVRWRALEQSPDGLVLGTKVGAQPGYPFDLAVRLAYELTESGLRVTIGARNTGRRALPYGAGQHPYFAVRAQTIDAAMLSLPADSCLELDPDGSPGPLRPVAGSDRDFRSGRLIGPTVLDTAYTGFRRDADGRARIRLDSTTVWLDQAFGWAMVYTGDGLAGPAGLMGLPRRRALAIEPMTCPPNAFQSGIDLVVLEPGEEHTANWGIEPESAQLRD
ncbi:MAG: aldose 1-epimerase family protein [Candidatus Limnocylindrales bacterium]